MLWKKMLRDLKSNFAQFFSIFLLSLVAMWCYVGFQANVIGGKKPERNTIRIQISLTAGYTGRTSMRSRLKRWRRSIRSKMYS